MADVVLSCHIPGIPRLMSGKVREVFDLGTELLIVATDRISAFDVILPTGIPNKGRVLTQISRFWFELLSDVIPNHMIATDTESIKIAIESAGGKASPETLRTLGGRSMLVKRTTPLPVECVARGYLSGSLWKEYAALPAHGGEVTVHGNSYRVGMKESEKLPNVVFSPATKAQSGHDENISFSRAATEIGAELASFVQDKTVELYKRAEQYAASRGIIIADTKFEFGEAGEVILIDEALTPDSSRFWDAATYKPGKAQASFDKQYVRDYLETLTWNKSYPGPELPPDIADKTAEKYRDAYRRITGEVLS